MPAHPVAKTAFALLLASSLAYADFPTQLSHEGVVTVLGERFTGIGAFRFALIEVSTGVNLWTNDGSKIGASCAGDESACRPDTALSLQVVNGIYRVKLADITAGDMEPIPRSVFKKPEIALRVWFDDLLGHGVHRLVPDVPVTVSPYALRLPNVYVDESTGYVGLGTTEPSEALDIERAAGPAMVKVTSQSGPAGVRLLSDAAGSVEITSPGGSDDLLVTIGDDDRLILTAEGNLGVGTNNPQQRLDVAGAVRSLGLITEGAVTGSGYDGWDLDASNDVVHTTEFQGDVTGTYDAIEVADDSHSHTDAKVADELSINNGPLYAMAGGDAVGIGNTDPQATLHVEGSLNVGDVLKVYGEAPPLSNCCFAHPEAGCDDTACADMVCGELTSCCTVEWTEDCVEFGQIWASEACGALCQNPQVDVYGNVRALGGRTPKYSGVYQPPSAGLSYVIAEGTAESDGFIIARANVVAANASCQIHGWIVGYELPLAAASINSVSGSDFPVATNSFTLPVRIGEIWRVTVRREAVQNQGQLLEAWWQPLGQ